MRRVFVGPLCRYFAADEAEAASRESGVRIWMRDISDSLAGRLPRALDWSEDAHHAPQCFDLGDGGLAALRLTAVYAERPELELPEIVPTPLSLDEAFRVAEAANFARSNYGHVLAAQAWLPLEFDFTFRVPRPDGEEAVFGSLHALRDQLQFLAQRTLGVGPAGLPVGAFAAHPFFAALAGGLRVLHAAAVTAIADAQPALLIGGDPVNSA